MGYTADLAELALSPGGAVIMFMMLVVGILASQVTTKYLIALGCTIRRCRCLSRDSRRS